MDSNARHVEIQVFGQSGNVSARGGAQGIRVRDAKIILDRRGAVDIGGGSTIDVSIDGISEPLFRVVISEKMIVVKALVVLEGIFAGDETTVPAQRSIVIGQEDVFRAKGLTFTVTALS